tara:strand:+ start:581 stop:949 length:369 start_codon:yes stop_codon:yes gene_type:complete
VSERIHDNGYIVVRRSGKERLSDHVDIKKDNWSLGSRKKLKASMRHKMKRIFVGILDVLDTEHLKGNIDEETFKRVRSRILNIGNDQIRNMEIELNTRYNIEALNYHVQFNVVGQGPVKGDS